MNNNNYDSTGYSLPGSQEKQLDAMAKLAVLSLTWSLAGLSQEKRSSANPERVAPKIYINLPGLKDGLSSSELPP
ncbi:hypothetical protein [Planktothrix paucivesiculata]|uniref:Uncharacterized protein n=1 Tax=Planktothrix paucivesiculata PCC 9631 TaxID=671071 RepID=A0A7Z9BZD9_9CYAN|nr:hypothetical protein [Planktothrix paucivesiculata]VXD24203.1 hypothetical protein PL9631_780089 [Planktothrix paucivesiculata PCC 9631]